MWHVRKELVEGACARYIPYINRKYYRKLYSKSCRDFYKEYGLQIYVGLGVEEIL